MLKSSQLPSLRLLHQVYRRHQWMRSAGLVILIAIWVCLVAHVMLASAGLNFGPTALNGVFSALLIAVVVSITRYLLQWNHEGFGIARFIARWEESHQALANRSSLLVYAEQHPDEVERLGYSTDLIAADDRWMREYVDQTARDASSLPIARPLAILAVLAGALGLWWSASPSSLQANAQQVAQALSIRAEEQAGLRIRVPEQIHVLRGDPLTLKANLGINVQDTPAFVHFTGGRRWESVPATGEGELVRLALPPVQREMRYTVSVGSSVSNVGRIIPLDKPSVRQAQIAVNPPDYTQQPQETRSGWQSLAAPRGSQVVIQATASAMLQSATIHWKDDAFPQQGGTDQIEIQIQRLTDAGDLWMELVDENGLQAESKRIRLSVIPDATPSIAIEQMPLMSEIPVEMVLPINAHAEDDYGVRMIQIVSWLNDDESNRQEAMAWRYSPEEADQIGQATDFFISFNWDLAERNLFPGDKLHFYLEAYDEDPVYGPKAGRTRTYHIEYPTLVDRLSYLNQEEEEQLEDLGGLVNEQRQIREDMDSAIESLREKNQQPQSEGSEDESELFMEKKQMEQLKERQEDLVSEARKIQEELQQYEEAASQEMSEEEQQEKGFTPDTIEKISRIQNLMQELLDRDSQQLMQKMQQTIDQLSREMDQEQLDDLQFSMQDFEQQLDRTLSMLEQTYQGRQMQAMQQMLEDLAERQEHLSRERETLQSESEQLAQQQAQLQQEMQSVQDEMNALQQEADQQEAQQQEGGQSESGLSEEERQAQMEALQQRQEELQKQAEELAQQREALDQEREQLAERQQRLQEDTQSAADRMQQAQNEMQEQNPQAAQMMEQVGQPLMQGQPQTSMMQAAQQLQEGNMQQAGQRQQEAQQSLQGMAEQMQQQMNNMGMQNMQQNSEALTRLVERGLFLSDEMEGLTESVVGQSESSLALQKGRAFLREIQRIESIWQEQAQTNPFMGRAVGELLRESRTRLQEGIEAGQGEKWLGLHESRQSIIALNQALYRMRDDHNQMMQQMQQQQQGSNNLQQQMQQMISQQQNLNQMMQRLQQMGEEGQQMMQRLQEMAQQQSTVRRQIEEMMRQYRYSRQLRNRLEGIYQEMREVERLLEQGESGEEVTERQQRILTRMLEAGTMQEEDELGRERRAETAQSGDEASPPEDPRPQAEQERLREAVERPPLESIPPAYREALKQHYLQLSETLIDNQQPAGF